MCRFVEGIELVQVNGAAGVVRAVGYHLYLCQAAFARNVDQGVHGFEVSRFSNSCAAQHVGAAFEHPPLRCLVCSAFVREVGKGTFGGADVRFESCCADQFHAFLPFHENVGEIYYVSRETSSDRCHIF